MIANSAGNNTIGSYTPLPVPGVNGFANVDIALAATFGHRYNLGQGLRLGIGIKGRAKQYRTAPRYRFYQSAGSVQLQVNPANADGGYIGVEIGMVTYLVP